MEQLNLEIIRKEHSQENAAQLKVKNKPLSTLEKVQTMNQIVALVLHLLHHFISPLVQKKNSK